MARSMLKSLAVLAPALPAVASANCFVEGQMYTGHQVIAPGYTRSPEDCQTQCSITLYCAYFTWMAQGPADLNNSLGLIGPGGCLKFNDEAVPVQAPGNASNTVSGPNVCVTTTLIPAGNGTATVPSVAPTQVPTDIPTGAPTLAPNVVTDANGTVNGTNGTLVGGGESSGGGFPWWAIMLIALAVVGVGAAVLFGMGGDKKKKKSKDSSKAKKKSKKEARQDASEAQALMRTEAPPPIVEPAAQVATQQPTVAPVPQYQGMAAPVATGSLGAGSVAFAQPQPAFGSGAQVMTPQGQVVYMQPQSMQMQQMPMQMMQPQYR